MYTPKVIVVVVRATFTANFVIHDLGHRTATDDEDDEFTVIDATS